jgi:hypothetical protein
MRIGIPQDGRHIIYHRLIRCADLAAVVGKAGFSNFDNQLNVMLRDGDAGAGSDATFKINTRCGEKENDHNVNNYYINS